MLYKYLMGSGSGANKLTPVNFDLVSYTSTFTGYLYDFALSENGSVMARTLTTEIGTSTPYALSVSISSTVTGTTTNIGFGSPFMNTSTVVMSDSGDRTVVVARRTSPTFAGLAYVITNTGTNYSTRTTQTLQPIATNSAYTVAISGDGNTIALGLPLTKSGLMKTQGQVMIYRYNGTTFVHEQTLTDLWSESYLGIDPNGAFGSNLALSQDGNELLVSTPFNLTGYPSNQANSGRVHHFKKISGTWEFQWYDTGGISAELGSRGLQIGRTNPKFYYVSGNLRVCTIYDSFGSPLKMITNGNTATQGTPSSPRMWITSNERCFMGYYPSLFTNNGPPDFSGQKESFSWIVGNTTLIYATMPRLPDFIGQPGSEGNFQHILEVSLDGNTIIVSYTQAIGYLYIAIFRRNKSFVEDV